MNAKALAASDYAGLLFTETAPKKLQIEAVQYVHGMCIELDIPVANFDLSTMGFGVPGAEPMLDKREINKTLMSFQALRAEKVAKISDADRLTLTEFFKKNTHGGDQTVTLQSSFDRCMRDFVQSNKNTNAYLQTVYKAHADLEAAKMNGGKDWEAIIGEIVGDGFFKFHQAHTGERWVEFTTAEVICTSTKKVGDKRLSVNMGQYKIRFHTRDGYMTIYAHKGNRNNTGCIHSFVAENEVCWGQAAPELARAVSAGDVGKCFALLRSLLTTFDSTNPYRSLESFLNPAITKWSEPYSLFNELSVGISMETKGVSREELIILSNKIRADSKFHPVWCGCTQVCQPTRVNHYAKSEETQVGLRDNDALCVNYIPKPVEPPKPASKPNKEKQTELKKKLEAKHAPKKRAARKPKIQTTAAASFIDEDWLSATDNGF